MVFDFCTNRWDRYDLLVMPPAFPFGGMENPRLTFVVRITISIHRSHIYTYRPPAWCVVTSPYQMSSPMRSAIVGLVTSSRMPLGVNSS